MTLEQDCVATLATQMGPAARAFLDRQCRHHLNKDPSRLQRNDLDELAKWCYVGTQSALGIAIAENIKKNILALK